MAKDWSKAEIMALSEMFEAGIPDDEIADCLGRSHVAIKVKRFKLGITGDHNARRISKKSRAKMALKPSGSNSSNWKGGRRVNSAGYIEVFRPEHHRARANGYVFEHILVVEEILGRKLVKGEEIHHVDRDKKNNSPDNLRILTKGEHSSLHGKLKAGEKACVICPICQTKFYDTPAHASQRTTCGTKCAAKLFKAYYTSKPRNHHISELEKSKILKEVSAI